MSTPLYKQQAQARVQPGATADSGLTLDSRGRPLQQALAGRAQRPDLPQ